MNLSARTGIAGQPAALAEAAVAVLGLLWLTGIFESSLPRYIAHQYAPIQWSIELLQLLFCIAPSALLLADRRRTSAALRHLWPVLPVVAFAAASTLWSIRPEATLRGSALLTASTLFGIFLGVRFDRRSQLALIGAALAMVAVGCLIGALVFPDHSIMRDPLHSGSWMGLYRHKNMMARDMALAIPLFVLLARDRIAPRFWAWSFAAVGFALIFASGSRTGGLVALLTTGASLWMTRIRSAGCCNARRWIIAGAAACVAIALFASSLLEWIDRDATLSGRTQLWSAVIEQVSDRPWTGYGYDAFWMKAVTAGEPAAEVAEQIDWVARHAHNGFLDIVLALGVLGLLLFFGPLAWNAGRFAQEVWGGNLVGARAWPAVFLLFWVLSNLTESPLLGHENLGWALYLTACVRASDQAFRTRGV